MLAPPAVTLRTTTLLVAGTLSAPLAFSSQPLERFRDVTKAAGITFVHDQRPTPEKHMSETFGSGVAWIDFDNDGYQDLYFVNGAPGSSNVLYRNNGDGTFTDVSVKAGIANPAGKGLGVTFCDVDDDGLVDIYVANDLVRNFLYRNNGDGTFRDIAYAAGVGFGGDGKPQAGMGTDCGDVDGDGRPDLYVTNFSEELNALYVNRGRGLFEDATIRLGLRSGYGPLGFGTKLFDMDNDGDLDIHVVNGHIVDNIELYGTGVTYRMKDLLYENVGGRFVDVSARSGAALLVDRVGRGQAVADFDNDGHLDIVISNLGGPAVLLKGTGVQAGNWLSIRAAGRKSNPHGLGARVTVETPAGRQVREINNVASYLSANDLRLHVGLGTARTATRVEIRWPSGQVQTLTNVAANQVLTITEP